MRAAQYLLDEQISPRVAEGLEKAGVRAVTVAGLGLTGSNDRAVFQAAVEGRWIMVTYDIRDYAPLYADSLKARRPAAGLVLVDGATLPTRDISGLVRALCVLAAQIGKGEVDPTGGVFLKRG